MAKDLPLDEQQIRILRLAFALRIEAMKKGRLSMDYYIESGKYHDDLTDANIPINMNESIRELVHKIFMSELAKASLNPKMYDL
jgi:hypothetical protein